MVKPVIQLPKAILFSYTILVSAAELSYCDSPSQKEGVNQCGHQGSAAVQHPPHNYTKSTRLISTQGTVWGAH